MADPDRLAVFVTTFKAKFQALELASADPAAELATKIERQRQTIRQRDAGPGSCPWLESAGRPSSESKSEP